MRNATSDNLQEHSLQTAMIAHALALIENKKFGGNFDPDKAAVFALYHDAAETITGDMPTPVKYFDANMRETYGKIEEMANEKLISMLPEEFRDEYRDILEFEKTLPAYKKLIKAADKLSAYLKCVEEEKFGNREFSSARSSTREYILGMGVESAVYFLENFAAAFEKPLDEISG